MSKESGMGSKKNFSKTNKGMGKCIAGSHGEQCGKAKEVSKGKHAYVNLSIEKTDILSDLFDKKSD